MAQPEYRVNQYCQQLDLNLSKSRSLCDNATTILAGSLENRIEGALWVGGMA